jgi:cell division protein FtsB
MGKLVRFRRKKKPTDARPASYDSDASTSEGLARPGAQPDPEIARKRLRRQRTLIFVLTLVFLGGIAAAVFGDHGYLDVQRQRRRFLDLRAAYEADGQRVEALKREVIRLKTDPAAVERIAREDLGYVAPGEITLLLPDDDDPPHALDGKARSAIVPAVRKSTP